MRTDLAGMFDVKCVDSLVFFLYLFLSLSLSMEMRYTRLSPDESTAEILLFDVIAQQQHKTVLLFASAFVYIPVLCHPWPRSVNTLTEMRFFQFLLFLLLSFFYHSRHFLKWIIRMFFFSISKQHKISLNHTHTHTHTERAPCK